MACGSVIAADTANSILVGRRPHELASQTSVEAVMVRHADRRREDHQVTDWHHPKPVGLGDPAPTR